MFLRKVVSRALLALLVGAVPALFVSVPARALTACDAQVVDGGRFLAGWVDNLAGGNPITSEYNKVMNAASGLRETGATVRVVTLASGYGGGFTAASILRERCPAWFDGDKLKSDYIVFLAVDNMGLADISYGSKWADTLSPQLRGRTVAERIRDDIMTPPFYDHQYAEGFVNAINETRRIITGGGAVTTPPAPFYEKRHATSLVEVEDDFKQTFANAGPTSPASSTVSEGYWSPRRLVGLVMVAVGVVVGLFFLRSRRSKSRKM